VSPEILGSKAGRGIVLGSGGAQVLSAVVGPKVDVSVDWLIHFRHDNGYRIVADDRSRYEMEGDPVQTRVKFMGSPVRFGELSLLEESLPGGKQDTLRAGPHTIRTLELERAR
jgi:hypothetical protein